MQTTRRYTVHADLLMLIVCRTVCLFVWMTCRAEWLLTGCSSTAVRLTCSGAHQHVACTRLTIIADVRIGSTAMNPVSTVRDLRIMLDAGVTMSAHISAVVKARFAALQQIRSVRHLIPRHALLTLIQALVVSKVDYCNSVLAGVSDTQLRRLQFVLNAAVRLVFSARRSEHITPLLRELHWLRIPERIKFRLCVLAF